MPIIMQISLCVMDDDGRAYVTIQYRDDFIQSPWSILVLGKCF